MSDDKLIKILDTANDISKLLWLSSLSAEECCQVIGLVIKSITKGAGGNDSDVPEVSNKISNYAKFYANCKAL